MAFTVGLPLQEDCRVASLLAMTWDEVKRNDFLFVPVIANAKSPKQSLSLLCKERKPRRVNYDSKRAMLTFFLAARYWMQPTQEGEQSQACLNYPERQAWKPQVNIASVPMLLR